ncbi:MAG: hypothetical protein Q8R28_13520 [Dehalococcoidia bacterium]|nr:hypothetical protein [Dehalococcoidia bacterium]
MKPEEAISQFAAAVSPDNRRYVLPIAKRYLAKHPLTKEGVDAYLAGLESRGYAPGTVRRHWEVLGHLFRVLGAPWLYQRGTGPSVRELDVYAPALDPALIRQMIRAARAGRMDDTEAGLLALSTTYGLRRVELVELEPGFLALSSRSLFIQTAKRGRQRYHLIPEPIAPYLARYPWPRLTEFLATQLWHSMEEKAGVPRIPEVGYHAVRRILVKLLVEVGVPDQTVRVFMRWRQGGSDMLQRYYGTTVVGAGGRTVGPHEGDRRVDEAVFALHPFITEWE